LHLAVADIRDNTAPRSIDADPVRNTADGAEKCGLTILFNPAASTPGVGSVKASVIEGHHALGPEKIPAEGFYLSKIDFHESLSKMVANPCPPPMQREQMAYLPLRRFSSFMAKMAMRVPLIPLG